MCVLITTDTIGGVWTFTRELIAGLLAEGCAVCCVSFGGTPSTAQCIEAAVLQQQGGVRMQFHATTLPLEWMENNDDAYAPGAELLLRLIAEWSPQVLHLNQFCYGALPSGLPRAVTIHSDVLSWAAACAQAETLPTAWLLRYRALVGKGIAGATLLTAPTQWMLQEFLRSFPSELPAWIVPNGIAVEDFAARPSRRCAQIVTAGRFWDKGKGLHLLNELESPWTIVVAGEAEESAAQAHVTYAGRLSAAALHQLFRECAVYLCASLYEPFGLAPLEAALCGCAVVARDLPSLREVWGDAAQYFADASELLAMLHALLDSPQRLEDAQASARTRARIYSRERMTQEYLRVYRHALEMPCA